jgi:hypothetical protein
VAALAPWLTPEQVTTAVTPLLEALRTTTDSFERARLAEAMAALALRGGPLEREPPPRLAPEQVLEVLSLAYTSIANMTNVSTAEIWATVIGRLLQVRPEAEHVAGVVEVLKYPTSAGEPSEVLLSSLRERFVSDIYKGNLQEILAWIRTRFPSVDLCSQAIHPDPRQNLDASPGAFQRAIAWINSFTVVDQCSRS